MPGHVTIQKPNTVQEATEAFLEDAGGRSILTDIETAMASAMGGQDAIRMARELVLDSPARFRPSRASIGT